MEFFSGCLVCGQNLVYLDQNADLICFYCGKTFSTNVHCTQGHYICDSCHSLGADDLIEQYTIQAKSTDPLELAVTLMKSPALKMHGPEHHFLVPAVLLAAYYNQSDGTEKEKKIRQARKRASTVVGGSCGFYGNCGAGVGTGIFLSLVTGATPLSKKEWQLCNRMTAESLLSIAEHGGPRCCKRDSFLAIRSAQGFLKENFGIDLGPDGPIRCEFSVHNKECLREECPFFSGL